MLKREDLLLVLFLKSDDGRPAEKNSVVVSPLAARLKVALADLETLFGLAVVAVTDPAVSDSLGVSESPAVVLFDHGSPKTFTGSLEAEDAAIEVVKANFSLPANTNSRNSSSRFAIGSRLASRPATAWCSRRSRRPSSRVARTTSRT